MKIKSIVSQNRRDFTADYECQHCGDIQRGRGYDDAYFHASVIPYMPCKACGKTGGEQTSTPTVPAGVVL